MAKTFFTSVGNSADSQGLAQRRATMCCTLPNTQVTGTGRVGDVPPS